MKSAKSIDPIVMIMFFILPQLSFSQKCNPETPCPAVYSCIEGHCKKIELWFCNCSARGYGCSGNDKCRSYCASYCGVLNDTTSTNILTNYLFPSNIFSFLVSRFEKKPTYNFEKIEVIEIIPGSTMQENIGGIEWSSLDSNENVFSSIDK
jgi:hypothetical protein